ncbi:hypothetical protein EVAR_14082_1 [Eumeta japonica]|uniref:Uncharacterized protein n=1 Tax=Eumeta variegata TaxID=151549 RepID=A0A4C1UN73_EUMVA|nr:hypothetical protein EVAR_14082_1 [Eumeta japonica]
MLDAVKGSVAVKTCRAYRTVSALIFLRLLPLGIRIRKTACLFEVKRGKQLEDIFADQELEYFWKLPHSVYVSELGFESIKKSGSDNGEPTAHLPESSRESKVSEILTKWQDGMKSGKSAYRTEPFCTVFRQKYSSCSRK